jgi:hypothetical protein
MADAPDALRREIVEAEQALYRTQIAGRVEAIRPFLARDLVYIHSTGVAESRDEYLAGVSDRLYEYGAIASREVRIQAFGEAVVMNGIVDMTVSARGASKQMIHLLFCLVWVRENGAWRLNFRQATRVP